jgi:hypothetical protein
MIVSLIVSLVEFDYLLVEALVGVGLASTIES